MMEAKNIYFSYRENSSFIENLNAKIPKGKVTTIIGPNGSGKSTLLSILSNLNKPQQGTVYLDNIKINKMKCKEIAQKIATVYQENSSPEDITVERLVYYGRNPHKKYFELENEEDAEVVEWAIKCTNLGYLKDKPVRQLSGGEKQRVWIAMALAQKPQILLLDEPTTYLDMFHQLEILELVKTLNKEYGITVVMVLHDINQAMKYSDNIIVMKDGSIVEYGNPYEIINEKLLREVYKVKGYINKCNISNTLYFVPMNAC